MSPSNPAQRAELAELAALAPTRHQAYAFLSAAYTEAPSVEGLTAIRGSEFLEAAARLFGDETLAPLRRFAAAEETDKGLQQTRREFMNLFKVPGSQYVTPYESVFRDAREIAGRQCKGLLMGRSAIDVQKWYRLAAVEIADEYKDLPDHIGLELNYLAHLCHKEQVFASAGDDVKLTRAWEMQRDFLASHIVPWVGELRRKIHEKSQHAYYRAIADMTVEFTRRDLTTLEDVLGPSEGASAPQCNTAVS